MSGLRISLFGKFGMRCDGNIVAGLDTRKVQQLFCYLLLYRDRPHPREALAGLLWDEVDSNRPNRCLRKTLWQLRNALDAHDELLSDRVLLVEPEWIQINPALDLWLDVALFEQAFSYSQDIRGRELDLQEVQRLQRTIDLYGSGLQESWYQDWYLYERERFQHMYLIMLDKVIGYCEAYGLYEAGLTYGTLILRWEKAHERTHRRLMRLYYLAGHRTAALRQYQRCVGALERELGVKPATRTVALYHQIQTGQLASPVSVSVETDQKPGPMVEPLPNLLTSLKKLQVVLADVQHSIQVVELAANNYLGRRPPPKSAPKISRTLR